jgi:predicted nicotinamide N-methyase
VTKTNNINIVRGLQLFSKKHPKLQKLLKRESDLPEIHGDKVWFSSYFIMDYLEKNPPKNKARVLEIGCGWGPLGIYCAKNFNSKVTATDADPYVFPFLDLHAKQNGVKITTKVSRYEDLKPALLAKQDLVAGGDICFWDELVEPLQQLIQNSLDAGVPRIIIADPGRPPFMRLARRCRKLFGAKLKSAKTTEPRAHEGYLLIVENKAVKAEATTAR